MSRNVTQHLVWMISTAVLAILLAAAAPPAYAGEGYAPVVTEFLGLMESREDLQKSVNAAIDGADLNDIRDMDGFVDYLDDLVTFVPTEREIVPECLKFYYIVNQAPGDALNRDEEFNVWMKSLVQAWADWSSYAGITLAQVTGLR